jgi:hypothetical protein
MSNIPSNKKLYETIIKQAKRKFKVWPSAYASGWVVKEYKRQGGQYIKSSRRRSTKKTKSRRRRSTKKPKSSRISGLSRWFAEEWINVCKLPHIVPCGRKRGKSKRNYPYCRPRYKITSKSPRIAKTFSMTEIKRRCSRKRKSPYKRIMPKNFKK